MVPRVSVPAKTTSFSKKKKTLVLQVDGQRKDSKRFILNIGDQCPDGVIRQGMDEPELGQDIQILEDCTDDEDEGRVGHKRALGDDHDATASSKAASKAAKKGMSEEDQAEDEMLF